MCLFCATYNDQWLSKKQREHAYEYLLINGAAKCVNMQDRWFYPDSDVTDNMDFGNFANTPCKHEWAESGFRKAWCKHCSIEAEFDSVTGKYVPNGK